LLIRYIFELVACGIQTCDSGGGSIRLDGSEFHQKCLDLEKIFGRSMIHGGSGLDIIFWWKNVDWEGGSGLRFLPESIYYLPG